MYVKKNLYEEHPYQSFPDYNKYTLHPMQDGNNINANCFHFLSKEEQSVTALHMNAKQHQPNTTILNKLRDEMLKLQLRRVRQAFVIATSLLKRFLVDWCLTKLTISTIIVSGYGQVCMQHTFPTFYASFCTVDWQTFKCQQNGNNDYFSDVKEMVGLDGMVVVRYLKKKIHSIILLSYEIGQILGAFYDKSPWLYIPPINYYI